jgi:hypothetical protein
MTTTALFSAAELGGFVQDDVDATTAAQVEQVVWGWLRPALGVEARPDTVTPELFSAALELGAIAYENPAGLSAYQLGQERWGYSSERREQILGTVASTGAAKGGVPRARFPESPAWPDPIRVRGFPGSTFC